MAFFIWIIIIIACIVYSSKKAEKAARGSREANKPGKPAARQTPVRGTETNAVPRQQAAAKVQAPKANASSTMDYLQEKADKDDLQERRRQQAEESERRQQSGNRMLARRPDDEGRWSQGEHVVICSYCNAENVVSDRSANGYCCYFCWEPLQD